MVREGDWKLAVFRDADHPDRFPDDDGLMLHQLTADPGERTNLAAHPQHRGTVARLLGLIDERDT